MRAAPLPCIFLNDTRCRSEKVKPKHHRIGEVLVVPVAGRYKFRRVSEVGRLVDEVLCPLGDVVLVLVTIVAEQQPTWVSCLLSYCHDFSALLMLR